MERRENNGLESNTHVGSCTSGPWRKLLILQKSNFNRRSLFIVGVASQRKEMLFGLNTITTTTITINYYKYYYY